MFRKFVVVLLILVFTTRSCNGQCVLNQLPLQQNFQIDKYVGKWYEILWCPPSNVPKYSIVTDYNTILTKTSGNGNVSATYNFRKHNYRNPCQTGAGTLIKNVQHPAKLTAISYDLSLGYVRKFQIGYWVISTDYTGYSIVYSCGNILPNGTCSPDTIDAAVWSRKDSGLTQIQKQIATSFLQRYCIDIDSMIATDHNHPCPSSSTRINTHLFYIAFIVISVKQFLQ